MMTDAIYNDLQRRLTDDAVAFFPELILCGGIVLLLLLRMFPGREKRSSAVVALMFTLLALGAAVGQWHPISLWDPRAGGTPRNPSAGMDLFGGMLVFDNFAIFLKIFLLAFQMVVIVLTMLTRMPNKTDSADFFTLLFGATLGMILMGESNHLLMVFIAIEMASIPSYAMAGFLKGHRPSSEAALKYVVYGGGAAGIMLYGISLLAGKYGTAYMPDLLRYTGATLGQNVHAGDGLVVVLGLLFLFIGIAFKLSAVPFHFWCPDVFEGAPAEVGGFLSIASKGAALALLARFTMPLATNAAASIQFLIPALAVVAAVTTTFGNLAAYSQTNLKRLLAYSTIAHAGFMIMGLATFSEKGAEAVLFYLVTYLLMNLGAFAVVAFLRNATGSEDLRDFRGLVQRCPVLVAALAVFLLSLVGLPPFAGFIAKFQIFAALFDTAKDAAATGSDVVKYSMYALVVVGGVNTVISLFYYVKVLKVMVLDKPLEEVESRPVSPIRTPVGAGAFAVAAAALTLLLGIQVDPLTIATRQGVYNFRLPPAIRAVDEDRAQADVDAVPDGGAR